MSYILVFENDPNIAETLKICLEYEGHVAVWCKNHYNIIYTLSELGPPKLILFDYVFEEDPQLVIDTIRIMCGSKIILMTGRNKPEDIVHLHGLDGLLKKPFSLEDLYSLIN